MITIFLRTVIIYVFLVFCMRLMGKRQIGELEVSDLVTTLLLSEIASLPITDSNIPIMHAIIPIITLVAFEVLSSYFLVRFPAIKSIVSARPTILINKGKLDRRAMLSVRLSPDELISELRQQGISDIDEVQYAILEQNGKITVIPKALHKPITPKDLNVDIKESGISHIVICEGKINKVSLMRLGLSKKELMERLAKKNVGINTIYIMMINDKNEDIIIKKE